MKKLLIILTSIILITLSILGFLEYQNNTVSNFIKKYNLTKNKIIKNEINKIPINNINNNLNNKKALDSKENNNSKKLSEKEKEELAKKREEEAREKIKQIRQRFSVKGIILKGDYYISRSQPALALRKYLEALKRAPNDYKILTKIGDTYSELGKYPKALIYYHKALNYNNETKEKYIQTLILVNTDNLSKSGAIEEITKNIDSIDINEDKKFYYANSLLCIQDFHLCKKNFGEYIKNKDNLIPELESIKQAFENYNNFQINELYYKNTLFTAALFENKLYPVVIYLSKEILKNKPGYKPVLLMLGKSYFETQDYKSAKKYLSEYYELDPNNFKVTYLLGIIAFKEKDYLTSNMYFNSAKKNGYTPIINLERRVVYNYFMLGDKKGLLDTFSELLKNKNATVDDFALGIYHAINQGKELTAISWAKKALNNFPNQAIFYGYLGRIYREDNQDKKALINLIKGLRIDPRNPLVTLNMGYLEESEDKFEKALGFFKTTVSVNQDGEFGILAKKEIKLINEYLKVMSDSDNTEKNTEEENNN